MAVGPVAANCDSSRYHLSVASYAASNPSVTYPYIARYVQMIEALGRAAADLANRRVLAIMLHALGVSVAIFIILGGLLVWRLIVC